LIAPSGPLLHPARLDFAVQYLNSLDLIPIVYESCTARYGYLAGADHIRAKDVNNAFTNPYIAGIFCIRGGYGAARILDMIDYDTIRRNPKFFCGYSDVTALHAAINQKAGLMTFHTPMLCEVGFATSDAYTAGYFNKYIFDNAIHGNFHNPHGHIWEFLVGGRAVGQLCGGNLTVLASLMGTPYEPDTAEKIIFIEDIGEEPYKIDRMLNQLHMAGKLDTASGMVFGDFTNCQPKNTASSLTISDIIQNLQLSIPVLYNFACGHCTPTASLPMGAIVKLDSIANSFTILHI